MGITRTAIVDDDGTGTTGTVINNSWKTELYNQIDSALLGGGSLQPAYSGGGGELSLAAGVGILPIANAAAITIAGIGVTGGVSNGQTLIIFNNGGGSVRVAHEDVSATAANRIIYGASIRGQILGVSGMVLLIYDTSVSRWRMYLIQAGKPITVPFAAGNFTASAGTWTVDAGDVALNQFTQEGSFLAWYMRVVTTSVSNAGASLIVTLPGGFSCNYGHTFSPVWVQDAGGAPAWGIAAVSFATTIAFYATVGVAGFAVSTNATEINMAIRFQIQ